MLETLVLVAGLLGTGDTLSGRVAGPDGDPVAGATGTVVELHRVALTRADGAYRFADLPPGHYTITVRGLGFAPVARDVVVRGATTLSVTLTRTAIWVEPVTVTATRAPLAAGLSPLPTEALSEDRLRREQSVSLAHALANLPGVSALTTGQQIGKPVIRGLTGPRVLVLEDGSRLEDYSWSDEDGPSVDARLVRRVELIRGPASVLYGSDALGGVVNVIPQPLPDALGGPGFVRTGFSLSAASNNIEVGAGARAEGARGALGWRVAAVGRGAGNLRTPTGELDNTGFGAFNGEGSIGWRWPSGGALALRVVHYGGEFKLLESNPAPGEAGGPERKLGDERLQITAQRPAGIWRLEAKGQLQRHSLIEVSDDSATGAESEAFNLLLQTASLDLLAHHGQGTIGLSGLAQTNDGSGRVPLVPAARTLAGGAFAFEQWTRGRWTVLAGARFDARRVSVDGDTALGVAAQNRPSHAWSANAGLVYAPAASLALSINAGRAWRAPTLFELFSNGPHVGEARYERGDATLRPEHSRSVDAGVRWSSARVHLELSAYDNRIGRYIYITPTAQFIGPLRVYQYAQAEAQLFGGEALVEAALREGLTFRTRVDVVRGTNLTAHEPLPLIPPLRATFGVGWSDRARLDVETFAKPDRLNPLDVPTPGYALLHLGGGTDVRLFGRAMRLDVTVRNVLDQRYRSFLSRYKEFAFDPGRNVVVRLSSGDVD